VIVDDDDDDDDDDDHDDVETLNAEWKRGTGTGSFHG
jgi:hypothetical protein